MSGRLEELVYEAALRALDKQERFLDELRSRAAIMLATSSLALSFSGGEALDRGPSPALAVCGLAAFVVCAVASVYVLAPRPTLVFAQSGPSLYVSLHRHREQAAELHRRFAYELDQLRLGNEPTISRLGSAHRFGAGALVCEILLLAAVIGGTLL